MKFDFNVVDGVNKIPREKVIRQMIVGTIICINGRYFFRKDGDRKLIGLIYDSFSCKGFNIIYYLPVGETRWIKIIRYDTFEKPKCYQPFKPNLRVKGYLVISNNVEKFKLKENDIEEQL